MSLGCERCGAGFAVLDGVAEVLREPLTDAPGDPIVGTWLRSDYTTQSLPAGLQPDPPATELLLPELTPSSRVLDLGCGTGGATFAVAQRAGFVLGVDIQRDRVAAACALQQTGRLAEPVALDRPELLGARCDFLVGDAIDPPVAGASWDAVVCLNLFDQVDSPGILLGQMGALLKPGGWLLFACPYQFVPTSPLRNVADPAGDLRHRLDHGTHGTSFDILRDEERLWVIPDNARRFFAYRTHVVLARRR